MKTMPRARKPQISFTRTRSKLATLTLQFDPVAVGPERLGAMYSAIVDAMAHTPEAREYLIGLMEGAWKNSLKGKRVAAAKRRQELRRLHPVKQRQRKSLVRVRELERKS